jgi:TetR/AcrR family transcriptional repressor of nem operon
VTIDTLDRKNRPVYSSGVVARNLPPSRERIIDSATTLMFRDGYEATGIQGVVDAAHVPRGSFFHHFPSKEHLGIVVLQRYARASEQRQIAAFENEEQSPTERLRSFFAAANDRVIADDFTKGCLIGNFTLQLSNTSEPIRQALVQAADETIDRIGRVLQAAKDAGELDPDVDPAELAELIWSSWEGAVLRSKLSRTGHSLRSWETRVLGSLLRATS